MPDALRTAFAALILCALPAAAQPDEDRVGLWLFGRSEEHTSELQSR